MTDTGSLSVNRYRWINIWTAILGHIFTSLPVFFEIARILLQWLTEIFPDTAGNARIYILHFRWVIGIKRRARLIKTAHEHLPRDATSSRVKTLALACGFVPSGATVEVIRDNEPLYSAESVAPFWCTYVPRNLHLAYLPMLYPSRRFSGLQGR